MPNIIHIPRNLRVLGIDLGTTNSTIAEIHAQKGRPDSLKVQCLEVEQYTPMGNCVNTLVPSFVALYQGREIVGEGAKQLRTFASDPAYGLEQNKTLFYECKNDMGIRRTYHRAPEGYRSAAEIGGRLLRFMHESALRDDQTPFEMVVITVPASFQAAQRADTLKAAELAGIKIASGDLLDEPVAAFLDYVASNAESFSIEPGITKRLMVFDFGGGTCDVAVLEILLSSQSQGLRVSPKAVSRYHRLGGGDIDAAILYEVLLPQLIEQNNLGSFDIGYEDKKRYIEPSYIGLAESLKIGLCREISRLRKFNAYDDAVRENIVKTLPGVHVCKLADGRELALRTPSLSAAQFDDVLAPFLDTDLMYARESEYRLTCSVFAPLQDALDRSGIDSDELDYCLMVGGSCLIPAVVDAVTEYFKDAKILTYQDYEALQTAIARGAAYHALSLAATGKGLVHPISNDTIAIKTAGGLVDLIPARTALPFPADGSYAVNNSLAVPETVLTGSVDLRLEIVAREDERVLLRRNWQINGPVSRGDKLLLEYRYDVNQILDFKLRLVGTNDASVFSCKLENPLTNVVNPQTTRLKIDEIEEELRVSGMPREQKIEKTVELAGLYSELGQHEKSLDFLGRVMRVTNRPDAEILNKMANCCGAMGDHERQEKYYREAATKASWEGAWFNLALAQRKRKKYVEALESVEKAIAVEREAPYLVLRAMIAQDLESSTDCDNALKEAFREFVPLKSLDDWELGWYLAGASTLKDNEKMELARKEQKRRKLTSEIGGPEGSLPITEQTPARRV